MSQRQPLTTEERAEFARRYFEEGDDRMIRSFEWRVGGSVEWLIAYPMGMPTFEHAQEGELINPEGAIMIPGYDDDGGQCIKPQEARALAGLLLQAADHAEFGPTE